MSGTGRAGAVASVGMHRSLRGRVFAIGIVACLTTAVCRREGERPAPAIEPRIESNPPDAAAEQVEESQEPAVTERLAEPPSSTKTLQPTAGAGFEIAAPPAADATVMKRADRLRRGDAEVLAGGETIEPDEDERDAHVRIWVGVEFAGVGSWLVHQRTLEQTSCDELVREVQEIAELEDGRWLVDAQLACRRGEDYFSAENAHTVVAVDPTTHSAAVLWAGLDTGSSAMGVCVSWSTVTFEVVGDELVIRRSSGTDLDREAAKELPEAARGCRRQAERTKLVERVSLVPPR